MQSKNRPAMTIYERAHVDRVKALPCGVCGVPGPSEAHHIEQSGHFLCIPCCPSCHRDGFNGWHGQRRIWKTLKKDELSVLNETIGRLVCGMV